VHAGMSSS